MQDNSKDVEVVDIDEEAEPKRSLKILIVEDEEDLAELWTEQLGDNHQGDNVTTFVTAEIALDFLRRSKRIFDWVITDRGLAWKMDGFGLAEAIKNEHLGGQPYITMITGKADEIRANNTDDQLKEKGIDSLLGKPFRKKHLLEMAETVRKSRSQSEVPLVK